MASSVLCAPYLTDALATRMAKQPYGTVRIRRYYATRQQTEYGKAGVEDETCVHALFSH